MLRFGRRAECPRDDDAEIDRQARALVVYEARSVRGAAAYLHWIYLAYDDRRVVAVLTRAAEIRAPQSTPSDDVD